MEPFRVLVVDDSAFMRKMIGDILEEDPQLTVVGKARNGIEAIEMVKNLHPHVVTLDVEMPVMNGLDALRLIMEHHPVPVVMLSSITKHGTDETIKALELGAYDFITKPSGSISLDINKVSDEICTKVLMAAQTDIKKLQKSSHRNATYHPHPSNTFLLNQTKGDKIDSKFAGNSSVSKNITNIIAIGTSTGGPKALQEVLTRFPASIPASIVVVQHMPPGFTKSLAERLDSMSEIQVKEAIDGEPLANGVAYIAPGDYHLEVSKKGSQLQTRLQQEPPVRGHRPAVNTLFSSIAQISGVRKYAIILTGMGNDGSDGLRQMKQTGLEFSIAEAEETCVVFGMPKAAIETGFIDKIVPIEEVAKQMMHVLK
ncbi:protein-glutamate methylesterase/protein-glutamine glutaminase [Rubeoparvulum massiliense]|uniref:protein-glutamate methylesterase/protein-glutamine glutaminase n=1 Tax=Rubeoparvulum massiliense TaxID=1631346 RepID=UPI00065E867D|nr:chemotaxis response regulator protein-glutamate methylesterase [Rubeoparvulum massiliense]